MDKLLPYIQEEIATYRRDCKVLGTRYPTFAGKVGFAEDGCGDPQVEWLLQSCGIFSAQYASCWKRPIRASPRHCFTLSTRTIFIRFRRARLSRSKTIRHIPRHPGRLHGEPSCVRPPCKACAASFEPAAMCRCRRSLFRRLVTSSWQALLPGTASITRMTQPWSCIFPVRCRSRNWA